MAKWLRRPPGAREAVGQPAAEPHLGFNSFWTIYETTLNSDLLLLLLLLVGCITSQQQASASQGRICTDNFTCCHTVIEVADQTFYLTQSQYTDTGLTSPSVDPIMPGSSALVADALPLGQRGGVNSDDVCTSLGIIMFFTVVNICTSLNFSFFFFTVVNVCTSLGITMFFFFLQSSMFVPVWA